MCLQDTSELGRDETLLSILQEANNQGIGIKGVFAILSAAGLGKMFPRDDIEAMSKAANQVTRYPKLSQLRIDSNLLKSIIDNN